MKSMTGYGYAEYACADFLLSMELKSYNNRFLEVSYSAPSYLSAYEQEINELIKSNAQRGHIDISIKIKNYGGNRSVSVDENNVASYAKAACQIIRICKNNSLKVRANLSDIMLADGVLVSNVPEGMEKYRPALDSCSKEVLKQFKENKEREGEATRKDLENMINSLDSSLSKVKANVAELDRLMKENLVSRIHEMLGDKDYDENRVLTEVAVMLVRYTINEEVVRLASHITEFRRLLTCEEPVGKKIDFLCQEMNREINTIGSKSQMVEVNLEVVNMKDCLENIREQAKNIE